jgi:hypothetical protein
MARKLEAFFAKAVLLESDFTEADIHDASAAAAGARDRRATR